MTGLTQIAELAARFGLRVTTGAINNELRRRGGTAAAMEEVIEQGVRERSPGEEAVMEAAMTTERHEVLATPDALARGILARQLEAGEANVGWSERGASRERRTETARVILNAIAGRGGTSAHDAARQAVREHLGFSHEGAGRIAEHAIVVLTEDRAREFLYGTAATVPVQSHVDDAPAEVRDERVLNGGARVADAQTEPGVRDLPELGAGEPPTIPVEVMRDDYPLAVSQVRAACEDAEEHGVGYIVDGLRVDPRRVRTFVMDRMPGDLQEDERFDRQVSTLD